MSGPHEPAASDFLDRMVGKAVGAADLVLPRVSGIYEPLAAEVSGEPADSIPMTTEEPDSAYVESPRRRDTTRTAVSLPPSIHSLERGHRAGSTENADAIDRVAVESDSVKPKPAAIVEASPEPIHAAPALPPPLTARRNREAAGRFPRVSRAAHPSNAFRSSEALAMAASTERSTDVMPSQSIAAREERASAADAEGVLVPPRNETPLSLPGRSQEESTARADRRRDFSHAPERETTVNVTIGRVEVRAVQSRPGDKAHSRVHRSEPLSLDAYLKQRGGMQ